MEYHIYKKINYGAIREYIGCCFVNDPDTEMNMLQIKRGLKHFGQKLSPNANMSSAKFVYVKDDDNEFEFVPIL
jgi:hypothetical protein